MEWCIVYHTQILSGTKVALKFLSNVSWYGEWSPPPTTQCLQGHHMSRYGCDLCMRCQLYLPLGDSQLQQCL